MDDATLTPSDYTITVSNIPKEMAVPKVKDLIINISNDISLENIHIAKRFDDRIQTFKVFIQAAKQLKDARTLTFRRIKETQPDKSHEEILTIIMDENYIPEGDVFGSYNSTFEEFKKACLACDAIEEEDRRVEGDGYNIDDFENVYA